MPAVREGWPLRAVRVDERDAPDPVGRARVVEGGRQHLEARDEGPADDVDERAPPQQRLSHRHAQPQLCPRPPGGAPPTRSPANRPLRR